MKRKMKEYDELKSEIEKIIRFVKKLIKNELTIGSWVMIEIQLVLKLWLLLDLIG